MKIEIKEETYEFLKKIWTGKMTIGPDNDYKICDNIIKSILSRVHTNYVDCGKLLLEPWEEEFLDDMAVLIGNRDYQYLTKERLEKLRELLNRE